MAVSDELFQHDIEDRTQTYRQVFWNVSGTEI